MVFIDTLTIFFLLNQRQYLLTNWSANKTQ